MNLIAKVMSAENIPDSDARKLFTLYPVPVGAYVEFRRGDARFPAEMYFIPDSDREPTTCVPLEGVGNVYVLQDGKTVSTFNPDPYPANITATAHSHLQGVRVEHTGPAEKFTVQGDNISIHSDGDIKLQSPSLSTGVARSQPAVSVNSAYADQLETLLTNFTSKQIWAEALNECIVRQLSQVPAKELNAGSRFGIFVPIASPKQDDAAMERYFNRVRDAFLNCTPRYNFRVDKRDEGHCLVLGPAVSVRNPPTVTPNEFFGDTVSGLLLNNIERAVSLWAYDTRTVEFTRPLNVSHNEHDLVKTYFRDQLNVNVAFNCQADQYLSIMLHPIQ